MVSQYQIWLPITTFVIPCALVLWCDPGNIREHFNITYPGCIIVLKCAFAVDLLLVSFYFQIGRYYEIFYKYMILRANILKDNSMLPIAVLARINIGIVTTPISTSSGVLKLTKIAPYILINKYFCSRIMEIRHFPRKWHTYLSTILMQMQIRWIRSSVRSDKKKRQTNRISHKAESTNIFL